MKRYTMPAQSLLEVVVAMAIVAIIAVSVVSTVLITQKTGKSAENNTRATKLVQDGIEKMRIFRDRQGYDKLLVGNCLVLDSDNSDPTAWTLVPKNPCRGKDIDLGDKVFVRKVAIVDDSSDRKRITLTVSWEESGGEQKVENGTYLSRWED